MFTNTEAYSGLAVDDLQKKRGTSTARRSDWSHPASPASGSRG